MLQVCESSLRRAGRNCKVAKPSCAVQDEIARLRNLPALCRTELQGCETFLRRAGRFPEAGNLPALCRTFSRSWKPSCALQGVFPKLETFLHAAGRFPEIGTIV